MKCPACLKDVKDGLIICPYCNTQFDYQRIKHVDVDLSDDEIDLTNSVNYERADVVNDEEEVEELIDYNPKVEIPNEIRKDEVFEASSTIQKDNNLIVTSQVSDAKTLEDVSFETKQQIRNINQVEAEERKKNKKISGIVSILSFVFLIGLIIILINYFGTGTRTDKNDETTTTTTTTKEVEKSKNKGMKSGLTTPYLVGDTVLASISLIGGERKDVDVTLNNYISGYDAYILAKSDDLEEGFRWYGMDLTVTLNDLGDIGYYDPVLKAELYTMEGSAGNIKYNDKTYPVRRRIIYEGTVIKNGESANIKVVYALPEVRDTNYMICLGEVEYSLGCFVVE